MDVNYIFEAFGKLSALEYYGQKRSEKIKQIQNLESRVCGNCFHWMKSTCKPEVDRNQFKNMNSRVCVDFTLNSLEEVMLKFKSELKEIDSVIAKVNLT